MRVGVLTGGGDCPGLNAVVRGIVSARDPDTEIFGFMNGWQGTLDGEYVHLTDEDVEGIHILGGTILGTSRTNPFKKEADTRKMFDTLAKLKIDPLPRRRRSENNRQRRFTNGLHLWVSHRCQRRGRCDRPPTFDGQIAQTGLLRGTDGSRSRLDRAGGRDGRGSASDRDS